MVTRKKAVSKKSSRKSSTHRKGAASRTADDSVEPATDEVRTPNGATAVADAPAQTPPKPARGDRPRKRARKSEQPSHKMAARAGAEVSPRPRVLSSAAQIEEQNGAIVVRFPPVAPSPFEGISPASDEPPEAEPIVEVLASAPPIDLEEEPAETASAERPAAVAPAREETTRHDRGPRGRPPAAPAAPARDEAGMTRSQRRRRRRRRGRGAPSETAAGAPAPATREPAPQAEPEAPEPNMEDEDEGPAWLGEIGPEVRTLDQDDRDQDIIEIEPDAREEPEDETATKAEPARPKGRGGRRRDRRRPPRGDSIDADHRTLERTDAIEEIAPEGGAEGGRRGTREMIINTVQREECRIAILNQGRLEEIYLERAAAENHVGNIYKGVVTNVEPSIQAAFVDFGQGKNGFLHVSDLHPQYFPEGGGQTENVGRKMPRRNRPPIQRCVRRGQELLVQVTKEGIGTKGPTLSTYLSIPGRFLVMMPGMRRLGVSRRIEDDEARDGLRDLLNQLELPEGMGFIARTAALGHSPRELQNDLSYLTRLWRAVERRIKSESAPAELYRESDLVIRTIRDVFTSDIQRIVIDDPDVTERAREFLSIFSPRSKDLVTLYDAPEPIFHRYKVEEELERLHSRHVPLPSGGSLVIDQTEALVAIDVNSGRFRSEDDAETTAFKINLEAADEIARQLRLRDLGGMVVCDFIDMRQEQHRREVERRLIRNLKVHKERAKVLRMSAFGIIELTRQRQRASLTRSVYRDCRHCRGTGLIKTPESVVLDVMRLIQLAVTREHVRMVEITVSPEVAHLLQNRKRALIHELETRYRRIVSIRLDPGFSLDQVEISCTDARGRVVPHV